LDLATSHYPSKLHNEIMSVSKGRRSSRYPAMFTVLLLAACAAGNEPVNQRSPRAPYSSLCEVFGFRPGTDAFEQCADEVDKAMWRHARSARAHLACTPMGDRTVCQ
jgi:hypothetical protein